jgi:hypothetical protein
MRMKTSPSSLSLSLCTEDAHALPRTGIALNDDLLHLFQIVA